MKRGPVAGSPGDLAVVVTKRTTDDPPLRPVATRGFAVLGSLRASNIGADVTLLSGGCKVAFGPMQPDIGPNVTRANASEDGEGASENGEGACENSGEASGIAAPG